VALATGAARGIGRGIALRLALDGLDVAVFFGHRCGLEVRTFSKALSKDFKAAELVPAAWSP
jgi:NAD(P)-dependent dehydrogenase (short-subunit alcohol dehydrogenase family)